MLQMCSKSFRPSPRRGMLRLAGACAAAGLILSSTPAGAGPSGAARAAKGRAAVPLVRAPEGARPKLPPTHSVAKLTKFIVERRAAYNARLAAQEKQRQEALKAGRPAPEFPYRKSGLGFLDAYKYFISQRAYPGDRLDWRLYGPAIRHRAGMPKGLRAGAGGGIRFNAVGAELAWEYVGPRKLDGAGFGFYGPGDVSGRANAVAMAPGEEGDVSTYYAAASTGGLWKTTDRGQTWQVLSDNWPSLQVSCIAVHPWDPNTVYVGTGDFHGFGGYSFGLMKTTDGGRTWTNVGASYFGSWPVSKIAIDPDNPNIILVTTGRAAFLGYVWRSPDGGVTWERPLLPPGDWYDIAISEGIGPDTRVYDVVGDVLEGTNFQAQIWSSFDQGKNWVKGTLPTTNPQGAMALAPSFAYPGLDYLMGFGEATVWAGAPGSWFEISDTLNGAWPNDGIEADWIQGWYDYCIAAADHGPFESIFVGLLEMFRTDDFGGRWRNLTRGYAFPPRFPRGRRWLSKAHVDQHHLTVNPFDPAETLFSNDGGVYHMRHGSVIHTGTARAARIDTGPDPDIGFITLDPSASSTDRIYAGDTLRITGGPGAGQTVIVLDYRGDTQEAMVYPAWATGAVPDNNSTYSITTDAFIDGLNTNLDTFQFYAADYHPTNKDYMIGGTQDNGSPFTPGDITDWSIVTGGDGGYCAINPQNPSIQFSSSQGLTIYRTGDEWASYKYIGPPSSDARLFIAPFILDPTNPKFLYAGTEFLHRWNDETGTWKLRLGNKRLTLGGAISAIAVAPGDGRVLYTGSSDGTVHMSTDRGINWVRIDNRNLPRVPTRIPLRFITSISVSKANPYSIIVTLSGFGTRHVWKCGNTKATPRTWRPLDGTGSGSLPDAPVNTHARHMNDDENGLFVGTDIGVFFTSNGGVSWGEVTGSVGLPNVQVNHLKVVPGTGYLNAATFGRGIWRLNLADVAVGPRLVALFLYPSTQRGGSNVTGSITLSQPAPEGGMKVFLETDRPDLVTIPESVIITAGYSAKIFTIGTQPVTETTAVKITARKATNKVSATLTLVP